MWQANMLGMIRPWPKQQKGPQRNARRQRSRHSPTSWRSDRRRIRSNVPRSKRRESEPKPARTYCHAHRGSRDSRARFISRPFRRRRTPVPARRHVWDPLTAIRSCDAKRSRECDREPFAGFRFQSGSCQSSPIQCRPGRHRWRAAKRRNRSNAASTKAAAFPNRAAKKRL